MFPTMNINELEEVRGISRYHEMMWIDRKNGNIEKVYDREGNELDKTLLYRSCNSVIVEGGFTYKGEFIPLEDVTEIAKKRALGYQRHTRDHDISSKM